jgi:hypothetical protein
MLDLFDTIDTNYFGPKSAPSLSRLVAANTEDFIELFARTDVHGNFFVAESSLLI